MKRDREKFKSCRPFVFISVKFFLTDTVFELINVYICNHFWQNGKHNKHKNHNNHKSKVRVNIFGARI